MSSGPATIAPHFPTDDSLCESCGYALRGLPAAGKCPECGRAISESDPATRTGLPWQNRASFTTWLATTRMMITRPREAFRVMRIGRPIAGWREMSYLLTFALLVGVVPHVLARLVLSQLNRNMNGPAPLWLFAKPAWVFVTLAVVLLVLIEALGVTWVAWRRGWRITYPLALKVACYAAVGWIPSAIFNAFIYQWYMKRINLGWYPFPDTHVDYIILMVLFMVSVLGFETLVWLGAKQVRFANQA